MFKICDNKGFHVTFDNGFTVSVQFGPGNYGDNYNMRIGDRECREAREGYKSSRAETAVWGPDGNFIAWDPDSHEVQGYNDSAYVLKLLNWAASQPDPRKAAA